MLALIFALTSALTPLQSFQTGMLQVEHFGKPGGQTIVFIPGLACGPWVWNEQIRALAPRNNVFVVALPGFDGRHLASTDRLMQRAVDSLHELIVSRKLERPIIVGHNLGGTIAVLFAETYPRDAAKIITVEGGYPIAPTQRARDAQVAQQITPYENLSQDRLAGVLRTTLLQYTITKKADVQRITPLAGRSEPTAIVAWMKAALPLDLTPKLSKIDAPFTAIIPYDAVIDPYQGFKTAADKRRAYNKWVAHTKRGTVVMIEGARHFVMIDQPSEFEAALERAL